MKFKGFGDWIEIFRGGKQVDSQGREHDGDALIDRAVATFDRAKHEPPVVVGHPVDDSPAFGWVEGLRTAVEDGVKVLLARFRQVVPEFAALVEKGVYKKRSASFYPDGRLRHVGFLGGAPPAVKGLADIGFGDDDRAVMFEFSGGGAEAANLNRGGEIMDKFKEFIEFLKFWRTEGKEIFQDDGKQFTEADLTAREEAAKKAAAEETRKIVTSEFAEKAREASKSRRREDIAAFCEAKIKEGDFLPAWVKMGTKVFMESLSEDETIQFVEGDSGRKSQDAWFKEFLREIAKVVEFKEIATWAAGDAAFPGRDLDEAGKRIAARVNPKGK